MSGEVMDLISSSLRMAMVHTLNLGVLTFIITTLLGRRRSLWGLGIYWTVKILIQSLLFGHILILYYADAGWFQIASTICAWTFAILTYVMYCYTFQGELLQIAVAAWIAEVTASFLGYFSIVAVNLIEGREDMWGLTIAFQPMDLLIPVIDLLLLALFYRYTAPYLRKFKTHKLRHRKLLWALFAGGIIIATTAGLSGKESFVLSGAWVVMLGCGLAILFYYLILRHERQLRRRQEFLNMQHKLMEMHYEIIQKQIHKMESSQRLIDSQMQEISKLESGVMSRTEAAEKITSYLAGLRQNYREIQAGMYCNDWMVDAVLYTQAELFQRQDIDFACFMQDYDRGDIEEEDMAQIALLLLDAGMQANRGQADKKIRLKAATVRNQLIIELLSGCHEDYRLTKRMFSPYMKRYKGTMVFNKEGQELRVTLTLQKG